MTKTEVIIVGAGPAGLSQALMLADAGIQVVLVDVAPVQGGRSDNRTAALLRPAVDILRSIEIDPEGFADTAPLRHLRLIDRPVTPGDAPFQADFSSDEISEPYFALNIRNVDIHKALVARVLAHDFITVLAPRQVTGIVVTDYHVVVQTDQGDVAAGVVIGADGRQSVVREKAGISTESVDYQQMAITCAIAHTCPHDDRSTEFHRPGGPFTLVPLAGHRSSVVWLERTDRARAILDLPADDFAQALQRETDEVLGDITVLDVPQSWPMIWQRATKITAPRVALVAEAAHALPPSGAQGLNLSLQDVATLSNVLIRAHRLGMDLGSGATLATYDRLRTRDMHTKTNAVDGLNRVIMTAHPALRRLRRAGLMTASTIPVLRRVVMRFGWMGK